MAFNKDFLASVAAEIPNPHQRVVADAIVSQLDGELLVRYLIKGFAKV